MSALLSNDTELTYQGAVENGTYSPAQRQWINNAKENIVWFYYIGGIQRVIWRTTLEDQYVGGGVNMLCEDIHEMLIYTTI